MNVSGKSKSLIAQSAREKEELKQTIEDMQVVMKKKKNRGSCTIS